METPPRAWGRPGNLAANLDIEGNTPTGVGKTCMYNHSCNLGWKHPHGRGEDPVRRACPRACGETPPRAWGRQMGPEVPGVGPRNTPTGVGKTQRGGWRQSAGWKHPHGRGEDPLVRVSTWVKAETPPRAWGRRRSLDFFHTLNRNTPTGVGKTGLLSDFSPPSGKHPHGRGEDRLSKPVW